ncbi:hypothetical protein [Novosphingobium sp. Leaf2]|uniref:hypothetical protein n=1 Tax=Novosphingobium sp. Leaf2 TaxID=1735670 RepID=UPI000AB9E1E4|nr:hypothetical protein [Novosphingobium sp. Leaf2]
MLEKLQAAYQEAVDTGNEDLAYMLGESIRLYTAQLTAGVVGSGDTPAVESDA